MLLKTLALSAVACFSLNTYAVDLKITTFGKKKVFDLKNASIECDGKSIDKLPLIQDGAELSIPISSIVLLRSLQSNDGFYLKASSGKELTDNKMACSNYKWIGENEFGGTTSVGGDKWRLVRVQS